MEKAEQERSATVEPAACETERAVKRSVAFGTEVADHGPLVPRPGSFDGIAFRDVGRQSDQREPARLFNELAGGDAAVRVDAIPDHDDGAGQVLVELFEELDDVLGANSSGNQAEEEAGSAAMRGVGGPSDRRQVFPVTEAMV